MTENDGNPNFRTKPRNRKPIIAGEVEKRLKRFKMGSMPHKKPSKGKRIPVWFSDKDLELLGQVKDFHQYATVSETIKQALKRDFLNVAVKREKIEEIRATMKRYDIHTGELN